VTSDHNTSGEALATATTNLDITSVYLQGIDNAEIIDLLRG
jgi:hypothetical protein